MFDLIIRNGRVVDGTGAPWMRGDIGIAGGRITAFGQLGDAAAKEVLDANGDIVCPGIVDIHSHSDWSIAWNPGAESTLRQGVTTEVVGSCGMSVFPVNERSRKIVDNLVWKSQPENEVIWRTAADWFDCVEEAQPAINVVSLVGHGTIRAAVIGDESRFTTPDELAAMERLLRQALDAGAAGPIRSTFSNERARSFSPAVASSNAAGWSRFSKTTTTSSCTLAACPGRGSSSTKPLFRSCSTSGG